MADAEILAAVQGLIPDDLQAAWEYAAENPAEIDRAIQENEEGEEGFVDTMQESKERCSPAAGRRKLAPGVRIARRY